MLQWKQLDRTALAAHLTGTMAEPIMPPLPDLASLDLAAIARLVAERRLPPVEQWNPTHCGDSEMRIAADGTWYHQGSPIGRHALVRLFSTVLRREADGSHVLVTPVEKLSITVEDAPFLAVEATSEGAGPARTIALRLNTDEMVIVGHQHRLRLAAAPDGSPRPYVHVRGGLEARINRPVFYQLADIALGEQAGESPPGLWSGGMWFAFAD